MMLKHMYTGDTDFIDGQNVLALLSLASHFGIHSLKVQSAAGTLIGWETFYKVDQQST